MREARLTLTEGNWRALELYDVLARRVVQDFQLAPLVFQIMGVKVTRDEARGLLEQLAVIHEWRCPIQTNG